MTKVTGKFLKISTIASLALAVAAQAELVRNPTQVAAYVDVGQIVDGFIYDAASPAGPVENQTITRTGVYLTESGVYHDRLTIRMTIGGLFWFAIPETQDFQTRRIQFGPGVGQVQGIYAFGEDPRKPAATLQFGLFSHKYSESVNLGEYLFRSGTYPGNLFSGGWSYMNAASYLAQGIRLTVPTLNGTLRHEFVAYMERNLQPAHDISPGYLVTYKPVPFLEVSAGGVWSHAISMNSKRLAPKTEANTYSKSTGLPIGGEPAPSECSDSLAVGASSSDCGYYTFEGFKVMGRLSADLGLLVGLKANDFKVYSEVALLGVEDQPYYYEDKMQRMPVMLGLNIPTFGLLDRLTLEGEYLASAFPNSNVEVLQEQLPIPTNEPYSFDPDDKQFDEIKWTIYARRKIVDGVTINAQAASDHLRHVNYAGIPAGQTATPEAKDWYYVIRLEFGI
jgi:hypothetical protein